MQQNERKNYYEVLEIPINSTPQEIDRAYNRAKNSYSGDSLALYSLMSAQECQEILNLIEEAYSVIGIPEKRREYDRARGLNQNPTTSSSYQPQPTANIHNLLDSTLATKKTETINSDASKDFVYEGFGSNQHEARVSKVTAIKKFQLEFQPDPSMEKKIEESLSFNGEFLKEIREYKCVTFERMVEMLKISKLYLKAIEENDFTKLPADVYARGFVLQYAKSLKLPNPDLVATSYMNLLKLKRSGS